MGDWLQRRYDAANSSFNPNEPNLSPARVRALNQKWRRDVRRPAGGDPGALYGAVATNGTVFAGGDAKANGPMALVGLDAATGADRWPPPVEPRFTRSAPVGLFQGALVLEVAGEEIQTDEDETTRGVALVDAATGRSIHSRWGLENPVLSGNRVYALAVGRPGHRQLAAYDLPGLRELWRVDRSGYVLAEDAGTLYLTSGEARAPVVAIDTATGAMRELPIGDAGLAARGLAIADGVLVATFFGSTSFVEATTIADGRRRWRVTPGDLSSRPFTHGVAFDRAQGLVLVTTGGDRPEDDRYVHALDVRTGERRWSYQGASPDALAVVAGVAFVRTPSALAAIDTTNGRELWNSGAIYAREGWLGASDIVAADGRVFTFASPDALVCFEPASLLQRLVSIVPWIRLWPQPKGDPPFRLLTRLRALFRRR